MTLEQTVYRQVAVGGAVMLVTFSIWALPGSGAMPYGDSSSL